MEPGPAFGVISMLCIICCLPFGAAAGAPVAVPCSFLYLLKSKDFPTAAVWWCCVVYGYTACFAPTGLIPRWLGARISALLPLGLVDAVWICRFGCAP